MLSHPIQRTIIHYCNLFGCSNCPIFGQGKCLQTSLCVLLICSHYFLEHFLTFWNKTIQTHLSFLSSRPRPSYLYKENIWLFFLILALGFEFSCWPRGFQLYFEKNKEKVKGKEESNTKSQWSDCKTQVWRDLSQETHNWVRITHAGIFLMWVHKWQVQEGLWFNLENFACSGFSTTTWIRLP